MFVSASDSAILFNHRPKKRSVKSIHLDKLFGVTALLKRFIYNCRTKRDAHLSGPTTVLERKDSLLHWVRSVQHNLFAEDIDRLRNNKECTVRL